MEGRNSSNISIDASACHEFHDTTETRVIKIIAYCVVILFSLPGNILVVVVILRERRLITNTNRFIVNMCVSDLLTTIFVLPLSTMLILTDNDEWPIHGALGEFLCRLLPFILDVSMGVSIFSMTVIAFDRYFAIVYPYKFHIITTKICYILIALVWAISLGLHSYYLIIGKVVKGVQGSGKRCRHLWAEVNQEHFRIQRIHFLVYFSLFYIMPLLSICFFYTCVITELYCSPNNLDQSLKQRRARSKENREVAIMLITVVVLFAVSWAPVTILVFLHLFKWSKTGNTPCFISVFKFITELLNRSNVAQNAFVYFTCNKRFKNGLKKLFGSSALNTPEYANGATAEDENKSKGNYSLAVDQNDGMEHLTTSL